MKRKYFGKEEDMKKGVKRCKDCGRRIRYKELGFDDGQKEGIMCRRCAERYIKEVALPKYLRGKGKWRGIKNRLGIL